MRISEIQLGAFYQCQQPINLYRSPDCQSLVTQAAADRYLRPLVISSETEPQAIQGCLWEDDYPGWLALADLNKLAPAPQPALPPAVTAQQVQDRIPAVIRFTRAAMACPNQYLWGGTVGPDYDCSGLIQAAFASIGILLPRDSYQQETFVTPVEQADLQPGDLIFFGTRDRTTHVALYLEDDQYIHSSGKDQGRNGIGVDSLLDLSDPISRNYHEQLKGFGRVTRNYQPTGIPISCR